MFDIVDEEVHVFKSHAVQESKWLLAIGWHFTSIVSITQHGLLSEMVCKFSDCCVSIGLIRDLREGVGEVANSVDSTHNLSLNMDKRQLVLLLCCFVELSQDSKSF